MRSKPKFGLASWVPQTTIVLVICHRIPLISAIFILFLAKRDGDESQLRGETELERRLELCLGRCGEDEDILLG